MGRSPVVLPMPAVDLAEVIEKAADVTSKVLARQCDRIDREGLWPEAGLRALQQAGLGGLVVPEAHGGLGHGLLALAQVCETLGRECASTAMCFGMHHVGAAVLAAKATPDQVERYLVPIARGRHLTTLALSEPGTGAHFYIPQATLTRRGEGYVLRGTKAFVTNGGHADSYVVSAASGERDAPPGQFSCVAVPADAPGLAWGPSWGGIGMRGNSSRNVDLREVPLEGRDLLGREGDQIWYVFSVVAPYFLVAMAGTYVGLASASLDEARLHLSERRYAHKDAALSRETVLQHRLGELWARVERTRALVTHAAALGDAGRPEATPALLAAKAEAADCAVTVTNDCMTLLGGQGYAQGGAADRRLRDARAAPVMAPTTDMLRTWTGRWLLGEALLLE